MDFQNDFSSPRKPPLLLWFMSLVLVALLVGGWIWLSGQGGHAEAARAEDLVENLVAGEEWIEMMSHSMNSRAKEIETIPVMGAVPFSFSSDLKGGEEPGCSLNEGRAGSLSWVDYAFEKDGEGQRDQLWGFLKQGLNKVQDGKFGFLSGRFTDESREEFEARVVFSAKGRCEGGEVGSFEAVQEIRWRMKEGGMVPGAGNQYLIDPDDWVITRWTMGSARMMVTPESRFKEVTEDVIPKKEDLMMVEGTEHASYLETLFSGGEIPLKSGYGQYFTTDATAQHPGLSVVDINGDGFDDLYVCLRWGRNLLFENQGDGTFAENASSYGLDLDGLSAAAIFADFDNDGDQDVVIGRSLERSLYLRNENGRFVDCSESHVGSPLPYLTTSLATADFNGDGLLDLYFSTYGFAIRQPRGQVARDFLGDYDEAEVSRRFVSPPDLEPYLNVPGPPNVLLVNTGGGRFEVSPLSGQVAAWRETLQATWADYDLDGDQDLYVCNDFAPDVLYRNEGGKGFTDVTAEIGHERMRGFGMGASFGDFDNDLDLDLYVSNMFSKAGLRIIDQVGMKDQRFRWSAEGNLLFGNSGGKGFEFLSGGSSPFAPVARADWSWGGQFCDFDNDGFLDLYVPNGYFTAPKDFAGEVDL